MVVTKVKTGRGTVRITPQDHFVKICHDELEALMGPVDTSLKLKKGQLSGIMMVGLQGSGKTTTTGKLASRLLKQGHRPLLVVAAGRPEVHALFPGLWADHALQTMPLAPLGRRASVIRHVPG